jgi:hypothetical protein
LLWYYSTVDIEWLKDHMFADNPRIKQMTEEQRERMMTMMSRKGMTSSGVIGAAIGLPLVFALQAGYYWLAGKVASVQLSFLQWFSLITWSSLPTLAGILASVMILATSTAHGQMGPGELQLLSLNELFFHRAPSEPGFQLLNALNLLSLWVWGLIVLGVRTWSKKSWGFSTVFVLLPFVVMYGGWALFAFKG